MIVQELWSPLDEEAAARLVRAVADGDLARALLALEGANERATTSCLTRLSAWGKAVDVTAEDGPVEQAEALAELLTARLHFRGDTADYYNPRNSGLSQVVERRQGLPILLACVWLIVGREAGLTVDGVGMPGHFIARVGGPSGVLIDPFHGGEALAPETCRAIVARLGGPFVEWHDDYLAAAPIEAIVDRVLNNLVGACARLSNLVGTYRALGLQAYLRPEAAGTRLRQAMVAERLGAVRLAADHYQSIIDDFQGTVAAEQAERRMADLEPVGFLN